MAGLIPFNHKNHRLFNPGFEDFTNMLDDFFDYTWPLRRSLSRDTFKLDVQETDHEYLIEAELPGVKKEEINLELNDGRLNISIERNEDIDEEERNYIHKERRHCSMQRSLYLADAKPEGVKAKLDNGVLNIIVPKQENNDNRIRIEVE